MIEQGARRPGSAQVTPGQARLARQAVALSAVLALVMVTGWVGRSHPVHLGGNAAPLFGQLRWRISLKVLPAMSIAALAVGLAPAVAVRVRWRLLLIGTWIVSIGWGLSLAITDGIHAITRPLNTPDEYLPDLVHVHGFSAYLAGFTAHINGASSSFLWSTHVAGGPPGPLLVFAGLARIGLGGPTWAALLATAIGCAAAPAAVVAARQVADETTARHAAPFVAMTPIAIWVVTSADALFLGISAWGIALLSVAATTTGKRADLAAVVGGLLLGIALYCSYGIAPLGLVAVAVVLCARKVRPLAVGALGVAAVAVVFAANGFWWWTGLEATRIRYAGGIARVRPYGYFVFADLAAFALSLGPAAVAGLACLQRRCRLWWLVAAAMSSALVSDLSGLSKGEVERIWLPFAIWPLLATAALGSRAARQRWLAAQALFAIALQAVLVSNW